MVLLHILTNDIFIIPYTYVAPPVMFYNGHIWKFNFMSAEIYIRH